VYQVLTKGLNLLKVKVMKQQPEQVRPMPSVPEYELNAAMMRDVTQKTVRETLAIEAEGYRCDGEMMVDVLIKAASENRSVEASCQELSQVADSNTIRERLNEQFDVAELWQQEAHLNQALARHIPDKMPRGGLEIAIDFHDEPFYGKSVELSSYAVRDRAKKGTTHFYRIASAYVIWRQVRLTLAVTYVLPEHDTLSVVKTLLQRVKKLNFHASVLYLDKGFCCGEVIQYLQEEKQAAILACPIRGKKGGTKALCNKRGSYRTTYTFTDGTRVSMVMVATLPKRRGGKRARKWLAYVVLYLPDWTPKQVKRAYRRRFGIECSYRQLRRLRIITNSRNPAFRFFVLGFGLLLVTIWAHLRWLFCRVNGRGRPRIDETRMRLQLFVSMLRRVVEQLYGAVMAIATHHPPNL
jgi:putative transposase